MSEKGFIVNKFSTQGKRVLKILCFTHLSLTLYIQQFCTVVNNAHEHWRDYRD